MAKLKAMKECKEQYEVIKAGVEALVQGQINSAIQHEEINKRIKLTVLKFADLDDASCESQSDCESEHSDHADHPKKVGENMMNKKDLLKMSNQTKSMGDQQE